MPSESQRRTLHIGSAPDGRGRVYVRVEFKGGKLSLCGVEGPRANGDAAGSSGQIQQPPFTRFARGWSQPLADRLWKLWSRWHLNDMRAGCEHQRAQWDTSKEIVFNEYSIEWTTRRQLERDADKQVKAFDGRGIAGRLVCGAGGATLAKASPAYAMLRALRASGIAPFEWRALDAAALARMRRKLPEWEMLAPLLKTRERRERAGWVRPSEHPAGLMCKPCDVCGYKYGTAWLNEDVPAEVIDELFAMPVGDHTPAWV